MDITYDQIMNIIYLGLLFAAAIAAVTPTEYDDKVVGRLKNIFRKVTGRKVKQQKPATDEAEKKK